MSPFPYPQCSLRGALHAPLPARGHLQRRNRLQSHTFSLGAPDISLKAGRKLRVTDSDPQALEGRRLKILTWHQVCLGSRILQNSTKITFTLGLVFHRCRYKFQASVKAEKAKPKLCTLLFLTTATSQPARFHFHGLTLLPPLLTGVILKSTASVPHVFSLHE